MTLVTIDLGADGIEYVKTCLRQATGLSAAVLDVTLTNGRAFAPVREGTTSERAKLFQAGGLLSLREVDLWLGEHIESLWQSEKDGVLVFQDAWAKPSDPVGNVSLRRYVNEGNVYYLIERNGFNHSSLKEVRHAIKSFLFLGFFSRLHRRLHDLSSGNLANEDVINDLARCVIEVYVGAYDQEGVVVWRK